MKKVSLWERYFTKEIGIELRACLYFFAIVFYYCVYRLCNGLKVADILHLTEMIILTYAMEYFQVFLLNNLDEADKIGVREILEIIGCSAIYALVSILCKWFDANLFVYIGYVAYMIFMYFVLIFINKYRRYIDDKILNEDLEAFKNLNNHEK